MSLRIVDFGPSTIDLNTPFNQQPDGSSAFWIKLAYPVDAEVVVSLNNAVLRSVVAGDVVSACVPTKMKLLPGKHSLQIADVDNDALHDEAIFVVEGPCMAMPDQDNQFESRPGRPNFFIVGAPRSGTTSMYWALSEHPQIFMTKLKEPFYFDSRAHGLIPEAISSEEQYIALFRHVHWGAKIVGEASTTYLSSTDGIVKIDKKFPDAKFLVMLRNPVQASISFFLRMKEGGVYETNRCFDESWRRQGEDRHFLNDYKQIFSIGTQLEHLYCVVGRERVKVVFFDDIINDSRTVITSVLEFLEIETNECCILKKGNSARWREEISIVAGNSLGDIREYFLREIEGVERLTGRCLTHWKQV